MKSSISPDVIPECDEHIKESRSRGGYTMEPELYISLGQYEGNTNLPYCVKALGRRHDFVTPSGSIRVDIVHHQHYTRRQHEGVNLNPQDIRRPREGLTTSHVEYDVLEEPRECFTCYRIGISLLDHKHISSNIYVKLIYFRNAIVNRWCFVTNRFCIQKKAGSHIKHVFKDRQKYLSRDISRTRR